MSLSGPLDTGEGVRGAAGGVVAFGVGATLVAAGEFAGVGGRDVMVTSGVDVFLPTILLIAPQPKSGRQKKTSANAPIRFGVIDA